MTRRSFGAWFTPICFVSLFMACEASNSPVKSTDGAAGAGGHAGAGGEGAHHSSSQGGVNENPGGQGGDASEMVAGSGQGGTASAGSPGSPPVGGMGGANEMTVQGPGAPRKLFAAQGAWHACYLDNDSKPHCWGHSSEGRSTPPADLRLKSLFSSHSFTCGIDMADAVKCWGNSPAFGVHQNVVAAAAHVHMICSIVKDTEMIRCSQRGGNDSPPVGFKAKAIDGEDGGMCAVGIDGSVACWGEAKKPPSDIKTAVRVAVSGTHVCAILEDQTVRCWGGASNLQPPAGQKVLDLAVARDTTCFIQENNMAKCIGNGGHANGYERLEKGVAIYGNHDVHCMLTAKGSFKCWGSNAFNIIPGAPSTTVVKGF